MRALTDRSPVIDSWHDSLIQKYCNFELAVMFKLDGTAILRRAN
jgi:hypothetical protein